MNEAEMFLQDLTTVVKPKLSLTLEQENHLMYDNEYEDVRAWIKKRQSKKISWSQIYFGMGGNFDDLAKFIQQRQDDDMWEVTPEEFQFIVWKIYKTNRNTWPANPDNVPAFPNTPDSAWKSYLRLLEKKNFSMESIDNISNSTQYIMSFLLNDANRDVRIRAADNPVRGMVVGNVQSGKTANMEGLIALASDYKYNFFIILTGTIDNLRIQTRNRFVKDFQKTMNNQYHCKWDFRFLDNVSSSSVIGDRLEDLDLSTDSNKRYVCVCLKNARRLENLRQWINKNTVKKQQLNVLLIDDEADQASLNSANISKDKITKINKDIKDIVFAKDKDGNENPYHTLSYIGYTATPYGNFLNEADDKSLYPTDFICGLHVPNEYIGPQQFFGIDGVDNSCLPIVNVIPDGEATDLKDRKSFKENKLPEGLEKSILWFICTVGIFRYRKLSSPVSMLIHTSQKVDQHKVVHDAVNSYLKELHDNIDEAISKLKLIYLEQTSLESHDDFAAVMPNYVNVENINDYPDFSLIEPLIREFLGYDVGYITMNEEGECVYHKGCHLCVDNCRIENEYDDDVFIRILYPEDEKTLAYCPAFIVIGGQTLSRGLTLQGLTVSYFLRSTVLADTLMQMGRWFGYRPGYELLCRLWISKNTKKKYELLTRLDYDLRELIDQYRVLGWDPKQYAPAIDTFPDFKYLKITSKSHMQKAEVVSLSYANKKGQTTKFFDNPGIIKNNYDLAIKFVQSLGKNQPLPPQVGLGGALQRGGEKRSHFLWTNVDYEKVFDFLGSLDFPNQAASLGDNINKVKEWFAGTLKKGQLANFNVAIPSLLKPGENNNVISLSNVTINPITRSKDKVTDEDIQNKVFRIPVITGPADYLCDIDTSHFTAEEMKIFLNNQIGSIYKRMVLGMSEIPLLLLYFINKDSGVDKVYTEKSKREPLNLSDHLFGYFIYIPGGKDNNAIQEHVMVQLEFSEEENDDEISM